MTTYVQIYDTWQSVTLKKQIVIAVLKAANDVINEDPATANHAARLAWAKAAVKDPGLAAITASSGVILNAVVQAGDPSDSDIQWVLNGLLDTLAGV